MQAAARLLGRQHHWRLAKQLAPGITPDLLRGWFQEFFMEGQRLPASPTRRMLWLVEVRAGFQIRRDSLSVLLVSAAIWREATRIRRYKRLHRKLRLIDKTTLTPIVGPADGPRKGITGNSAQAARRAARNSPKLPPQL